MSKETNKVDSATIRKSISILIEMRRNLMLYNELFGNPYPGNLWFELTEWDENNNDKTVRITVNPEFDSYVITTVFDNKSTTITVGANKLPVSTIISLLELFPDVRTYWKAFEAFNTQQSKCLLVFPVLCITERLVKYLISSKSEVTLTDDKLMYTLWYSEIENKICLISKQLNKTFDVDDIVGLTAILESFGFTYYQIYSQIFFNPNY